MADTKIYGDSIELLLRRIRKQFGKTSEQASNVVFNLGADIQNQRIKILEEDILKTDEQKQNVADLISKAPTLREALDRVDNVLSKKGYRLTYGYDPLSNILEVYPVLESNKEVKLSPLKIEIEDIQGKVNMGGAQSVQVMVMHHGTSADPTKSGPMITSASVKAIDELAARIEKDNSKLNEHLASLKKLAEALKNSPDDQELLAAYDAVLGAASRSFGYDTKKTLESIRTDKTYVGRGAHIYRTQNPAIHKLAQQTISYKGELDEFFNNYSVKAAIKKAGESVGKIKTRIQTNLLTGGDIHHAIPTAVTKLPEFQQFAATMQALQSIGISINQLNDESVSNAQVLGVGAKGGVRYGQGRLLEQLGNIAPISVNALKARRERAEKRLGAQAAQKLSNDYLRYNQRFLVKHVTPEKAKKGNLFPEATPEGGIYLSKDVTRLLTSVGSRREKFSTEQLNSQWKKQLSNLEGLIRGHYKSLGYDPDSPPSDEELGRRFQLENNLGDKKEARKVVKLFRFLDQYDALDWGNSPSDAWYKEAIYAKMTGERFNWNRYETGAGYENFDIEKIKDGQAFAGWLATEEPILPGTKIVGGGAGGRNVVARIGAGLSGTPYDAMAISSGGKIKSRKLSQIIFEPLEGFMEFAQDFAKEGDTDWFKTQYKDFLSRHKGNPLKKYFKYDKNSGRYVRDEQAFKSMEEKGEIESFAKDVLDFFSSPDVINDLVNTLGIEGKKIKGTEVRAIMRELLPQVDIGEETTAEGKKVPLYTLSGEQAYYGPMNVAALPFYGMPNTTTLHYDETIQRDIKNAIALAGIGGAANNPILKNLHTVTEKQQALQTAQQQASNDFFSKLADSPKLFESSPTKGNKSYYTAGFGDAYDIDLSQGMTERIEESLHKFAQEKKTTVSKLTAKERQEFQAQQKKLYSLEYDAFGNITQESYQRSGLAYIMGKAKEKAEAEGIDVKNLTIYFDPTSDPNNPFTTRELGNVTAKGQKVTLNAAAVPLAWTPSNVNDLTNLDKERIKMIAGFETSHYIMAAAKRGIALPQDELEWAQTNIDDRIKSYAAEQLNTVEYAKNPDYQASHQTIHDTGVWWGVNIPEVIQTIDTKNIKGYDHSTAYMSPAVFDALMKENFVNTPKGLEAFKEFYKIVTQTEKAIDDLGFDTLEEGFNQLKEDLKDTQNGISLFGALLRYPSIMGRSFQFVNWKVADDLGEGVGVRMSRGLSKLINGDFDGDRIAAMALGIDVNQKDWKENLEKLYNKKAGLREKMTRVTQYAATALEAQMAEDEAKGKPTLDSITLAAWGEQGRNFTTEVLRPILKAQTGQLSNFYQSFEQWAADNGLNEEGLMTGSSFKAKANAGRAIIGRFLLSDITQEAISAKKLGEFFQNTSLEKWNSMSLKERGNAIADIVNDVISSISELQDTLKEEAFYKEDEEGAAARADFLAKLEKLGVVKDGVLPAKTQAILMGSLYSASGGKQGNVKNLLEQLFGKEALKGKTLPTFDAQGNVTALGDFNPTAKQMVDAFAALGFGNNGYSTAIIKALEAGKQNAREITAEQVISHLYKNPNAGRAGKSLVWGASSGGKDGYISIENAYIEAANVVINAQNVSGGGGGGVLNEAALALYRPDGLKIDEEALKEANQTAMTVTQRAGELIPGGRGTLFEQFYTDYAAMEKELKAAGKTPTGAEIIKALKEDPDSEFYRSEEGEGLIKGAIDSMLSTALGSYGHSLIEALIADAKTKGSGQAIQDEADKELRAQLGKYGLSPNDEEILPQIEKIRAGATTVASQLEKTYGSLKNLSTEADLGFYNPQTGERLKGRTDYTAAQEYIDGFGKKQMRFVIGDYKFYRSDRLPSSAFAQLAHYQNAVAQLLENWDALGITDTTTAEELNKSLTDRKSKRGRILSKMTFFEGRGQVGDDDYIPPRLMDEQFLTNLKAFHDFYKDFSPSYWRKQITGEIIGVNKATGNLNIRRNLSIANLAPDIQAAIVERGYASPGVQKAIFEMLNPKAYYRNGKKVEDEDIRKAIADKRVTGFEEQGTATSLSKINQLLTQRLQLEREIAEVEFEREATQRRVDAGDTKAAQDLIQIQARLAELDEYKDEIQDEIKAEGNTLTASAQNAFHVNELVKTNINARRIGMSKQDWQDKESVSLAREYERIMTQRLQVETKIDQMTQQRNTTFYRREIDYLDEAIRLQNQKLAGLQQEAARLAKNTSLRKSDREAIERDYQSERNVQKAQNTTRNHGIQNIWDMMAYDIQRSMMMVFNFGFAHRAINSLQTKIRELIATIQQLDVAMTNIRIVTGYSQEKATDLMKTYNDLASQLGVTTQAVAEASNEWLRQGYQLSTVEELVSASVMLAKLGMIDASEATEYLTSTLKGFKMEASEVMDILDILTELDLAYAASSSQIAEALSRTATSAQLVGMSLEETAAALTTIIDVSQRSASSVGEAWRTLTTRYSNVAAGNFEDLLDGDDEGLNDVEKVFNTLGISIRDSKMEFRDFSDVLDDLAEKWINLSSVEQSAVATALAGTRQRETFLVLMENYDSYREALESAEDSSGTAESKYEAYLDSIEAHLNQLAAAWEGLAHKFEASNLFKMLVDFATFLVEALPTLIKYVSTLFVLLNSYKIPTWFKDIRNAINPFGSTKAGKYAGSAKFFTKQGVQDRKNIYEYERRKAAGEDVSDLEAKLPEKYRQRTADQTDPMVSKVDNANKKLDEIAQNTAEMANQQKTPEKAAAATGAGTGKQPAAKAAAQPSQGAAKPTTVANATPAEQGQEAASITATSNEGITQTQTVKAAGIDHSAKILALRRNIGRTMKSGGEAGDLYHQNLNVMGVKGRASAQMSKALNSMTDEERQKVQAIENINDPLPDDLANSENQSDAMKQWLQGREKYIDAENKRLEIVGQIEAKEAEITRLLEEQQESVDQTVSIEQERKEAIEATTVSENEISDAKELQTEYSLENTDAAVDLQSYAESTVGLEAQSASYANLQANSAAQELMQDQMINTTEGAIATAEGQQVQYQQTKNQLEAQELAAKSQIVSTEATGAKPSGGLLSRIGGALKPTGTSAQGSVAAGLTSAISAFATQEGDTVDKLISGATSGVLAGVGTALGGPIGGMIGSVLSDFLTPVFLGWLHADEEARKERVEEAEELLDSLSTLSSSVENVAASIDSRDEWTAEDYAEMNDSIKEILMTMYSNSAIMEDFLSTAESIDQAYEGKSVTNLLQLLIDGTEEQANNIILALQQTVTGLTAEATYAAQEADRYEAEKALQEAASSSFFSIGTRWNEGSLADALSGIEGISKSSVDGWYKFNHYLMTGLMVTAFSDVNLYDINASGDTYAEQLESLTETRSQLIQARTKAYDEGDNATVEGLDKLIDVVDEQIAVYEENIGIIEQLNAELNEARIADAFVNTVGQWDSIQIANASLEEAIFQMAQELTLIGALVYDETGQITDEARNYIMNYLREQEAYSSLFATDDTVLRQLLSQQSKLDAVLNAAGMKEYGELVEAFKYNDEKAQEALLEKLENFLPSGANVDDLAHLVYSLDPTSIESFATALGVTTQELTTLQDKLGNVSLADLMADSSDTLEEFNDQMDILNEIMEDGCISAESYFEILTKYTELLYEYDSQGNLIGLGTENIVSNLLANLYGSGGNLGTLMGYQNYEELKTNTNIYDAFKEIAQNTYGDKVDLSWMELYDTFSDDALVTLKALSTKDTDLWALYTEIMSGMMADTSDYQELVQSLMDYEITMIEQEIDSLESMKDALSAVNDERDKELELIKAKNALENAKEEKVMVYRAGEIYALDNYIG